MCALVPGSAQKRSAASSPVKPLKEGVGPLNQQSSVVGGVKTAAGHSEKTTFNEPKRTHGFINFPAVVGLTFGLTRTAENDRVHPVPEQFSVTFAGETTFISRATIKPITEVS